MKPKFTFILATVGAAGLIYLLTLLGAGVPLRAFGPIISTHLHFSYSSLEFGLVYLLSLIFLRRPLQEQLRAREHIILPYVILFPLAMILYSLDGYTKFGGDTTFNVLIPPYLLHGGSLPLSADFVRSVGWIGIVRVEGGYMPVWPLGASLFVAPFSFIQFLFGVPDSVEAASYAQRVAAAMTAAFSSALLYSLLLQRSRNRVLSSWLAIGFAFGSPQVLISAKMLWQHGPAVCLLLLGLSPLVTPGSQREEVSSRAIPSGFFHGLLFLVRPQAIFFALAGFLSWGILKGRGAALRFALSCGLPILALMAFNLRYFSNLGGGYGLVNNPHPFGSYFVESLAGLWVAPNRGLLIFSPFLFWGLLGVARYWRTPRSWEFWYAGAAIAYIFLHGLFVDWRAGWTIGPRYMTEIAPLLTLFAADVLERRKSRIESNVLLPGLVILSLLVCFPGSLFSDAQTQWNIFPNSDLRRERAWQIEDWLPLHFLKQGDFGRGRKTDAAFLVTNELLSPPSDDSDRKAVAITARPHWQRISELPTVQLEPGEYEFIISGRMSKSSPSKIGLEIELVSLSLVHESFALEQAGPFEKTYRFSVSRAGYFRGVVSAQVSASILVIESFQLKKRD